MTTENQTTENQTAEPVNPATDATTQPRKKPGRKSNAERAALAAARGLPQPTAPAGATFELEPLQAVGGAAAPSDEPLVLSSGEPVTLTADKVKVAPEGFNDPEPAPRSFVPTLGFFRLADTVVIPSAKTSQAAGMDVCAHLDGSDITAYSGANREFKITPRRQDDGKMVMQVPPGVRLLVPTGLIADIPQGYKLAIYPRSSPPLKDGLTLANNVAQIDSDYTNEIFLVVVNNSDSRVNIAGGDRLAQCALEVVQQVMVTEIASRPQPKGDRVGGLGSTGRA